MDDLDTLMNEYEEKFGEMIPLKLVHVSEEDLKRTLRECIQTGDPYKLGKEIRELLTDPHVQF